MAQLLVILYNKQQIHEELWKGTAMSQSPILKLLIVYKPEVQAAQSVFYVLISHSTTLSASEIT
jgi:hypothetical protein